MSQIHIQTIAEPERERPLPPILTYGFRPFFLLAGIQAVAAMAIWLFAFAGYSAIGGPLAPSIWHGHEMIFGFGGATVAGFLLTAVPSWTNAPPLKGRVLLILAALWLAGRIGFWSGGFLPWPIVALADLSLFPLLAFLVGRTIFGMKQSRNYAFPFLLLVLTFANLLVHLEALGAAASGAALGLKIGIYVLLTMIAIVGGRIIPQFTGNALKMRGIDAQVTTHAGIAKASVAAMIAAIIADLSGAGAAFAGPSAIAAGILILLRMKNWLSFRTWPVPILWVLHAGYFWLGFGFLLSGIAHLFEPAWSNAALHALTVGAVGTMTLAVMSRAALGHTGRKLEAAPLTVAAYVLVILAALVRVLAPVFLSAGSGLAITIAGALWCAGFLCFVFVYAPILIAPRAE